MSEILGDQPAQQGRTSASSPIVLGANQPPRPYRGGHGIARFRHTSVQDDYRSEDFIASTTQIYGGTDGLSRLPDGRTVREAVRADPVGFLGPRHVERFGPDPALLVKLLNPEERLFVHYHPTDAFAAAHLGSPRGKTEAWIVVDVAENVDPYAYVGFRRPIDRAELFDWFDAQDGEAMLAAMTRVPLAVGTTLLVPAGLPHAIGPGLTLVEVQQPTDLSIILEYAPFERLDPATVLLGLPPELALSGVNRDAQSLDDIATLISSTGSASVLPPIASSFFRVEHAGPAHPATFEPSFAVLIVTRGRGELSWDRGRLPVRAGQTLLVPYDCGTTSLVGPVEAVRCLPPAP